MIKDGFGCFVGIGEAQLEVCGDASLASEVGDLVVGNDVAIDDDHAVTDHGDFGQDVGAEDDGVFLGEIADGIADLADLSGSRPLDGSLRI